MNEILFIAEEDPGRGFTTRSAEHFIFTMAETYVQMKTSVSDAFKCHH